MMDVPGQTCAPTDLSRMLNKYYLRSHVAFKSFQKVGPVHNRLLVVEVDDLDFCFTAQENMAERLRSVGFPGMVLRA